MSNPQRSSEFSLCPEKARCPIKYPKDQEDKYIYFFSFISVHILLHLHVNFLTCELQFPFTFHLNFHVWKSRESIPETNLVSLRKRRRRTPYPLIYFTPKGFTAELETATDTLFVCVPLCLEELAHLIPLLSISLFLFCDNTTSKQFLSAYCILFSGDIFK